MQKRSLLILSFHGRVLVKGGVKLGAESCWVYSESFFPHWWAWISTLPESTQAATLPKKLFRDLNGLQDEEVFYGSRLSDCQGKMSSPLILIFECLPSSFHVLVLMQAYNLFPALSPGSDSSLPQARPSKTNFPSHQCHASCSQSC